MTLTSHGSVAAILAASPSGHSSFFFLSYPEILSWILSSDYIIRFPISIYSYTVAKILASATTLPQSESQIYLLGAEQ